MRKPVVLSLFAARAQPLFALGIDSRAALRPRDPLSGPPFQRAQSEKGVTHERDERDDIRRTADP